MTRNGTQRLVVIHHRKLEERLGDGGGRGSQLSPFGHRRGAIRAFYRSHLPSFSGVAVEASRAFSPLHTALSRHAQSLRYPRHILLLPRGVAPTGPAIAILAAVVAWSLVIQVQDLGFRCATHNPNIA